MAETEAEWWTVHDNLVILTRWMADNGWTPSEIARCVEKPWSYTAEFAQAMLDEGVTVIVKGPE
jgi:hypothetical protein